MKKIHIIIILLVAVVSAILVSTYTASVDSATFAQAKEQGKQVKIVGSFDKTQEIEYDAMTNADLTVFYVTDKEGKTERVNLIDKKGKPMGLEQSESVTIEGKYDSDGNFHASHLLMKCPSKYNEQNHAIAEER